MFSYDTSIKIIFEKKIFQIQIALTYPICRVCSGFQENQGNSIIYHNQIEVQKHRGQLRPNYPRQVTVH